MWDCGPRRKYAEFDRQNFGANFCVKDLVISSPKTSRPTRRHIGPRERAILDASPYGAALLDDFGKIIAENATWRRFVDAQGGEQAGFGVGGNIREICRVAHDSSIEPDAAQSQLLETLSGGGNPENDSFSMEFSTASANAHTWLRLTVGVTPALEKGGPSGALATITEIPHPLPCRDDTRPGASEYLIPADAVPDFVCSIDGELITYVNDACVRALGAQCPEDLLGSRLKDLLTPEYRELLGEGLESWLEETTPLPVKLLRLDGSPAELEIALRRLSNDTQARFIAVGRDMTEQKQAALAVLERERRISAIMENVADGIITIDETGRIDSFNHAATTIFGYKPDDVIGRNVKMLMTETDQKRHDDYLRNYRDSGVQTMLKSGAKNLLGRRQDGTTFPMELAVRELTAGSDKIFVGAVRDITERQMAEQALEESEKRFRDFAESAGDWLWEMDRELRFSYISEGFFRIFPLDPTDILGKSRQEFVSGETSNDTRQYLDDIESHRPFQDFTYEMRLAGGRCAHVRTSGKPIFDEDGIFCGYRGTACDVTGEVQARKMADTAQSRLRDAIDAIAEGFALYDADDRLVMFNERYAQFAGDVVDLLKPGVPFEEIFRATVERRDYSESGVDMERWVADRMTYHNNPRGSIERPNFDDRWIRLSESRTREGGIVAVHSDITELRHREEQLRDSENRLKEIVDNAPMKIALTDSNGRYVLVNGMFAEALAMSTGEVCGRTPGELFDPRVAEKIDTEEREVRESRGVRKNEISFEYGEETRHEQVIKFPILDSTGAAVGVGTIISDMTEHKRLEEQLRESEKLNSLGQLAGGVAHDFNNILMVISGYTKRALAAPDDREKTHTALSEVVVAAEKAAGLTKQLLAFGRRQMLEKKVIRGAGILTELSSLLLPLLGETVSFIMDVEDDRACIETDPAQLTQALMNLALNARDAMPGGGQLRFGINVAEEVPLAHREDHPGPHVKLTVKDSGSGMDEKTLARIYEPFFTTKDQGKGTGLGLAMVYGFIQQAGGIIDVSSIPGEGTSFEIYLPVAEGIPDLTVAVDYCSFAGNGETILLAEDDDSLRRLAQLTFEELGYKVIVASDGFEALELESEHEGPIDMLVSDVVMPGLSGFELSSAIRETRPDIKIILMSGYPSRGELSRMEAPAGIPLLQKPLEPETLARNVRECLDGKNMA